MMYPHFFLVDVIYIYVVLISADMTTNREVRIINELIVSAGRTLSWLAASKLQHSCSTWVGCFTGIGHSYFVTATAMSYTGSLLSRKRYLPMSVRAAAESIASLPTRFLSKYGVASRPWAQYNFAFVYTYAGECAIINYNFQLVGCSFHLRRLFFFSFYSITGLINRIHFEKRSVNCIDYN